MKLTHFLTYLCLGVLVACGGYRPDRARGPWMLPHEVLSGRSEGFRLVMDRNGNITQNGRVERQCQVKDRTRGNCQDRVQYFMGEPDQVPEPSTAALEWEVFHRDGNHMEIRMRDERGELRGTATGPLLLLSGRRKIPLSQRSASAEVRYHRLPGPRWPMLVEETYSLAGVSLGSVQTIWLREP